MSENSDFRAEAILIRKVIGGWLVDVYTFGVPPEQRVYTSREQLNSFLNALDLLEIVGGKG